MIGHCHSVEVVACGNNRAKSRASHKGVCRKINADIMSWSHVWALGMRALIVPGQCGGVALIRPYRVANLRSKGEYLKGLSEALRNGSYRPQAIDGTTDSLSRVSRALTAGSHAPLEGPGGGGLG
jgi:hypothetical protein